MAGYMVTAPCALVHIGGKLQYLYEGAVVPDGVDAAELDRLAARGLLGKVDATAVAAADGAKRPARPDTKS